MRKLVGLGLLLMVVSIFYVGDLLAAPPPNVPPPPKYFLNVTCKVKMNGERSPRAAIVICEIDNEGKRIMETSRGVWKEDGKAALEVAKGKNYRVTAAQMRETDFKKLKSMPGGLEENWASAAQLASLSR